MSEIYLDAWIADRLKIATTRYHRTSDALQLATEALL